MLSIKFTKHLGKEMAKNIMVFFFFGVDELYFQQFYFYRLISFLPKEKRHKIVDMKIYGMAQHLEQYDNIDIFEPCQYN
jgi:hypothetical protein